jgi:hypothetical protein
MARRRSNPEVPVVPSSIRSAYSIWPELNRRLRDVVAGLTEEQLAIHPAPGRWPLWATVGHLACQRVFGFCNLALEPGADATPFTNAAFNCPGDEDLEHVWSPEALAAALDSTFAIVERALDTWTPDALDDLITHPEQGADDRVETRGRILQRSFAHDVSHITELNETLGAHGIAQVNLWDWPPPS